MKIYPLHFAYNNIIYKNINLPNNKKNSDIHKNSLELNSFYYPVFGCSETDTKDFVEELSNLQDIHCPHCGVEMVSRQQRKELLNQVSQIDSSKALINFLRENKERLSKDLSPYLEYMESLYNENPSIGCDDLVNETKKYGSVRIISMLDNQVKYLSSYQKTNYVNYDDNRLVEIFKQKIKDLEKNYSEKFSFKNYKNALQDTIAKMENYNKWQIYTDLKQPILKECQTQTVFNFYKKEDDPSDSSTYLFLRNLLSDVTSRVDSINYDFSDSSKTKFNKILVCNKCFNDKNIKTKYINYKDEYAYENYVKYLDDICNNVINGNIKTEPKYPLLFNGYIKKLTKGGINVRHSESLAKLKDVFFEEAKKIDFKLVSLDNVPCASCGQYCLSHDKKMKLYDEITNAESMQELENIFDKNIVYVRSKFIPIVRDFKRNLKYCPQITDKEMIESLREISLKRIRNRLIKNRNIMSATLNKPYISDEDKVKIKEYIQGVNEIIDNIPNNDVFRFGEYGILLEKTIFQTNYRIKNKYYDFLRNNIKDLFVSHMLVTVSDALGSKYDSYTKIAVQNVFKMSVATKDHVVARNLDGEDDKSNFVVLCKDCNHNKTNYTLKYYNKMHPETKDNFIKYIMFVKDKIKSGELDKNYIKYIKDVSNLYDRATDGAIKVPENIISDL